MTPGGTGTGAGLYTYVASPTVTSVAPSGTEMVVIQKVFGRCRTV
jgi:hypothetical protein